MTITAEAGKESEYPADFMDGFLPRCRSGVLHGLVWNQSRCKTRLRFRVGHYDSEFAPRG